MSLQKNKKEVDIIDKVLEVCYRHNPDALFIMSLMHQYEERGSLSKKQLEGLLHKAQKVPDIPENWRATLEARILKMPNRFKSTAPVPKQEPVEDTRPKELVNAILARYPTHKRVVFFKLKLEKHEPLSAAERSELERFHKALIG